VPKGVAIAAMVFDITTSEIYCLKQNMSIYLHYKLNLVPIFEMF